MNQCIGCARWYTYFCSYVTFNKMQDNNSFMFNCPCSTCLVKITCQLPCDVLGNYFIKNLRKIPKHE